MAPTFRMRIAAALLFCIAYCAAQLPSPPPYSNPPRAGHVAVPCGNVSTHFIHPVKVSGECSAKGSAAERLYTIDPFIRPPRGTCGLEAITLLGDFQAYPVIHATCRDRIKFVMRPIRRQSQRHGIYTFDWAAWNGTISPNSPVPCHAAPSLPAFGMACSVDQPQCLGYHTLAPMIEVNTKSGNYEYTTPRLGALIAAGHGSHSSLYAMTGTGTGAFVQSNSTTPAPKTSTLVFTCPAPFSSGGSHCTDGMWLKVVVNLRAGGCCL